MCVRSDLGAQLGTLRSCLKARGMGVRGTEKLGVEGTCEHLCCCALTKRSWDIGLSVLNLGMSQAIGD